MLDFTIAQWAWIIGGAAFIGVSRTAIRGSTILAIPIFAAILGARTSSAVVLLLYIIGDVVAIRYYLRNTQWRTVLGLLPWALVGIVVGAVVGESISDDLFRKIMGVVLLTATVLLLLREFRERPVESIPRRGVTGLLGLVGGFSSMIGNAAGPLMNLYLLSRGYTKREFLGTTAWFFFLVNASKVPMHIFYWRTITIDTAHLALILAVPVLIGTGIGVAVTYALPQRPFRIVIVLFAAIASLRLVLM